MASFGVGWVSCPDLASTFPNQQPPRSTDSTIGRSKSAAAQEPLNASKWPLKKKSFGHPQRSNGHSRKSMSRVP